MRQYVALFRGCGIPLEHLLLMFYAESGLDPQATSGAAWGINQAQGPLLKLAGFHGNPPDYCLLSVREQLPIVRKCVQVQINAIGHAPQTPGEVWRMNLSPSAAQKRSEVIYARDNPAQRRFYEANKALDTGNKGTITLSDLETRIGRTGAGAGFLRHRQQLDRIRSEVPNA